MMTDDQTLRGNESLRYNLITHLTGCDVEKFSYHSLSITCVVSFFSTCYLFTV